jgi:5-methylcytosine-specific restriction protein B
MPDDVAPVSAGAKNAVAALFANTPDGPGEDVSYEIEDEVADTPLVDADIAALVATAAAEIANEHFLFPEAESLIERAVVGLLGGNLVLHGPPGTGKTRLAAMLSSVFDCTQKTVTGTPDWSTYDVVGGLRPSIGEGGQEVLQPWLGHVPLAALRCAATVKAHLAGEDSHQAHWLVIDELSRADIDKAIGPLYTALSGSSRSQRQLDLWFEDSPERSTITLPERFRLVATMNDVDTAFVNQISQGLQRRFKFVYVGVPADDEVVEEVRQVSLQAGIWHGRVYGEVDEADLAAYAESFATQDRVEAMRVLLAGFVAFVRWEDLGPRWPLGSAQLVDVMRELALRAFADEATTDLTVALDRALADRVMSQASALTEEQLKQIEGWLVSRGLTESVLALRRVREPHTTHRGEPLPAA